MTAFRVAQNTMGPTTATVESIASSVACREKDLTTDIDVESGGLDLMCRIEPEWLELCRKPPNDQPFYRPEWIRCYLRAFAPNTEFLLIAARVRGRLKAVLPLTRRSTLFCGLPVTKLQGAANVHSVRFDLIYERGAVGDAAVAAIWHFLRTTSAWDVIELPNVPQGGAAEKLLSAAQECGFLTGTYETMRSPYIPLAGSKRSTARSRRSMRKAAADWTLRMKCTESVDAGALQRFYHLEDSGWKGKKGTSILSSPNTRQFYDEVASSAAQSGYFALYLLNFDNTTVAGHFGVIHGGRYYLLKCAYNEDFGEYCPGHLIVANILEDSFKRGLSEFDFTGPTYPWKAEWTSQVRPHGSCYIFRKGVYGSVLRAARFRVRPFVKEHVLTLLAVLEHWRRRKQAVKRVVTPEP